MRSIRGNAQIRPLVLGLGSLHLTSMLVDLSLVKKYVGQLSLVITYGMDVGQYVYTFDSILGRTISC